MNCKDKVVIVTGAAGNGMGRSIALTLAREGAKVIVNYKSSSDMAEEIVNIITKNGGSAIAIQADIQNPSECQLLVKETINEYGRVDVCIIGPGCGWHMNSLHELDAITTAKDVADEVSPVINLLPLVLPDMYKRRWGRIVGLGLEPDLSSPSYSYNVAKGARAQSLLLAKDEAWKNGVTINIIAPGPVNAVENVDNAYEMSEHKGGWIDRKEVTPQDIAEAVAFICSQEADFITGCTVPFKETH